MVSVEEIHVVSAIRTRKVLGRQVCLNAHKDGRIGRVPGRLKSGRSNCYRDVSGGDCIGWRGRRSSQGMLRSKVTLDGTGR